MKTCTALRTAAWRRSLAGAVVCLVAGSAGAVQANPSFADLDLAQLMNVTVTSVAKKEQRLHDAAAAVFVISADDIRRSGVTSIPEALRMAPGVEVARLNGGVWAVTARGFNSRFAAKLLVLVDGRSVYTPLFSGVLWDAQDTLLEDVERIEVIRSPGAALWGSNAMNGIINIITRQAGATQGALLAANAGTQERAQGVVRLGMALGEQTHLRLYTKLTERTASATPQGTRADDASHWQRAGFRLDDKRGDDHTTLQGELFQNRNHDRVSYDTLVPPFVSETATMLHQQGGHLLGRWEHALDGGGELRAQAYLEHTQLDYLGFAESRDTADVDLQHRSLPWSGHELTIGGGYRSSRDEFSSNGDIRLDPAQRRISLLSVFIQDDIALRPDMHLILGNRTERSDSAGWQHQPNVRLRWSPNADNTLWAAASRAVRMPSRVESDGRLTLAVLPPGAPQNPGPLPVRVAGAGSPGYGPERVDALELGYRTRLGDSATLDVAAFRNQYRDLRNAAQGSPVLALGPVPHVDVPVTMVNSGGGHTRGVELALDWRPLPSWRLQGSYTFLDTELPAWRPGVGVAGFYESRTSPRHRASLRSGLDLGRGLQFDLWLRHVGRLPTLGIPAYTTFDARLAWTPRPGLELSLVGQNLAQRQHAEFAPDLIRSALTEVRRGVYGRVRWSF